MKKLLHVTAALILDEDNILITQRHCDGTMGGKWEFPGGKIEPGETPEACLQRELQEELGILADIHELFAISRHTYPQFRIALHVYTATIRSGTIQLFTHQDFRWVLRHELKHFDFLEADQPIVEKLLGAMKEQRQK